MLRASHRARHATVAPLPFRNLKTFLARCTAIGITWRDVTGGDLMALTIRGAASPQGTATQVPSTFGNLRLYRSPFDHHPSAVREQIVFLTADYPPFPTFSFDARSFSSGYPNRNEMTLCVSRRTAASINSLPELLHKTHYYANPIRSLDVTLDVMINIHIRALLRFLQKIPCISDCRIRAGREHLVPLSERNYYPKRKKGNKMCVKCFKIYYLFISLVGNAVKKKLSVEKKKITSMAFGKYLSRDR